MFRIGEFSRLAQLSIRVLRHYDEIGLLIPAHVDTANGYRYYSANQLAEVNRIVALKELGLSLEQVHKLVREQISAAELTGILRLEAARAEQARADAERRLRGLAHRLDEIANAGSLSDIDVVVKSVTDTAFLSYRATVTDLEAANTLTAEVLAAGGRLQHRPPLIVVAHDTFFDTENLDLEYGFAVSEPAELAIDSQRRMTVRRLPGAPRMLSIMLVGDQDDGHRRSHHALGSWLARHGCHLNGPGREIIHDAGGSAQAPTIEIQYPVDTSFSPGTT